MEDWSSFNSLMHQIKENSKSKRLPFNNLNKNMTCIKEIEGFTIGKKYKLIGCAGEYVQVKDDNGDEVILFESYFQ